MQIVSGLEQNRSSSAERFGRSHCGKVLWAILRLCQQDQTLLSHPCCNSHICESDVSFKIIFAQGFHDEPGSNLMSLSHHLLNWSILTARKHLDLAVWLLTLQRR